jgi:hypothetical protein
VQLSDDDVKARVRAAFPVCTAVADQFREVFGDGVKLSYAEENGQKIGRQLPESIYKVVPMRDMVIKPSKVSNGR